MRLVLTGICLTLTACGDTGSYGSPYYCYSDGPLASNLVLARSSAFVGEGGASIAVDATFDYKTRSGAKIEFIDYRVVAADGQEVLSSSVDINLKGSGTYTFSVPIGTEATQRFTVRVRVFDECLEKSKWLEAAFEVLVPAALAGKSGYATAQSGGFIYFIGGRDGAGQPGAGLLQYDPASGRLQARTPLPEAREFAAAVAHNGVVYVFGGEAFGFTQASTFAYDTASDTWSAVAPMPVPLAGAVATVVDDLIYIDSTSGLERYDPMLDLWTGASGALP